MIVCVINWWRSDLDNSGLLESSSLQTFFDFNLLFRRFSVLFILVVSFPSKRVDRLGVYAMIFHVGVGRGLFCYGRGLVFRVGVETSSEYQKKCREIRCF